MAAPVELPAGFTLDAPTTNPAALPPGFKLDQPTPADTLNDVAGTGVRGFNNALVNMVTAPYRALRSAAMEETERAQKEGYASPYRIDLPAVEDMPLFKPYMQPLKPETTAGKYAGAVGEALGASALPSAGLMGTAERLATLAPTTTARAIGQTLGETVASAPGRAVAADVAAATGAGLGQEAAHEGGFGPIGQTVAGLAAGAAPLAAGNLLARGTNAFQAARANADPYARVAKGLGDQTVDELANSVAVGTSRNDQTINRRVLDTLGDEMVKADGDRSVAIPATLQRLETEGGVTPATAQDQLRRIVNAQAENPLMLGEYPAVAAANAETRLQRPANISDEEAGAMTNPGTHRLIDYVANTGSMASSQNVKNAIGLRAQGLKQSTEDAVASMAPNARNIQDVAALMDSAEKQASAEYGVVHNTPALTDNAKLHQGLQDIVDTQLNKAAGRSGEQAEALRKALDEFFIDLPNGQKIVMPTLQMAQDMRGALRGIITRNKIAGNDHIVNTLQPLYKDVTQVMTDASPAWAKVNAKWADLNLAEVATDLGDAFAKQAGPKFREQMAQFQALAPEAQDIVRIHFTQQLLDKIENAAKLGGMANLGELFAKAHTRNMVREILGDDAAVKMARLVRDANVMARSRDMLKGSPTQPRQQMQQEQDRDINMISAAENFDWKNWRQAIFDSAKAFWRERRNKVMGKVITTPMRDTPAIAEHLQRMRQAQERSARYAKPVRSQVGAAGQAGALLKQIYGGGQ
jgi:hypothetical protein